MKHVKMPCGCVHELEREKWTRLCEKHQQEFSETHERWAQEHKQRRERDANNPKWGGPETLSSHHE